MGVQQGLSGKDHSRRAKPALNGTIINKSLLDDGQLVVFVYHPLDGNDIFACSFNCWIQTGINNQAIDQNRAGATLSLPTAFFGPFHVQWTAQQVEERLMAVSCYFNI